MAYKCSICGEPGHNVMTCPKKGERKATPAKKPAPKAKAPKAPKGAETSARVEGRCTDIVVRLRVVVSIETA